MSRASASVLFEGLLIENQKMHQRMFSTIESISSKPDKDSHSPSEWSVILLAGLGAVDSVRRPPGVSLIDALLSCLAQRDALVQITSWKKLGHWSGKAGRREPRVRGFSPEFVPMRCLRQKINLLRSPIILRHPKKLGVFAQTLSPHKSKSRL